jgi:hypothetical protein
MPRTPPDDSDEAEQRKAERETKRVARRNRLMQSGGPVLYRFDDLVAAGFVENRTTLLRLIDEQGFPPGMMIGGNTRAWRVADVEDWLAARPTARKVLPANAGNPRVRAKRRAAAETQP